MNRIDEFIAQGILPFVGREEEMAKILAFWRSVPEGQRLRVMLLIAEAGVGKSRLLEEALAAIRTERGAVIHVKLYPEAANSLAALLSRSMWISPSGRAILHNRPGENLPEVIGALQRLCRLRPALLVLEDIHLFPSESIPDLVRLFEGLMDETLSVLCLSRPTSFAAQGILERYLVDSVTMEGLGVEALTHLWHELFGSPPPEEGVQRLHAVTRGNGLALRSGLRGAVQNGLLQENSRSGEWRLAEPMEAFEGALRRSVSLVVEGMVAHLDREKRKGAEQLATLGEVFARETAIALNGNEGNLLDDLIEQGIIVETIHPLSPLAGRPHREPGKPFVFSFPQSNLPLLAFTHSLLHDYLAGRAAVNLSALLRIIGEDYPLYSLLPLRFFETVALPKDSGTALPAVVMRRVSAIAQLLDRTAQWRDAVGLLKPLNRLLEYLEADPGPSREEKLLWRMQTQHASLSILRRSMHSPEWIALHERQLETTRNVATYDMAQYRMLAKSYEVWRIDIDKEYAAVEEIIAETEKIIKAYPPIVHDIAYIYLLESLIEKAHSHGDYDLMRFIDRRSRELLAAPDLPDGTRLALEERILPNVLRLFETPEELREREESINIIEERRPEDDPYYGTVKVQFLGEIGRFHEAVRLADPVIRRARERGLWMSTTSVQNWRTICGAGLGYSLSAMTAETVAMMEAARRSEDQPSQAAFAVITQIIIGLLSGKIEEGIANAQHFAPDPLSLSVAFTAILRLWQGEIEDLRRTEQSAFLSKMYFSRPVIQAWKRVAEIDRNEATDRQEEILSTLLPLFDYPVLHLFDVLTPWGTLHLWRTMTGLPPGRELTKKLTEGTLRRLEWLHERGIGGYMGPLIELLEELGEKGEGKKWRERMQEIESITAQEEVEAGPDGKIMISMLGSIRVALPGQELAPIRGVRIRTLLGLMVADALIASPLSHDEFLSLAGGHESDSEHARKKKNMAVVRLREIIGHHAIRTDGPTPQLNTDLLSVDLLLIDDLVRRALAATRRQAFVRALPLIEEALTRYGGEVPFPTLYENFFEAARNDFEYRLRQAILETGRGMIEMGDAGGAEGFLRRAFEALPGDEEIGELLRQTLEGTGNRIEAERIRLRMA